MRVVRQRLSCAIVIWLVCQLAGLAAVPASLAALPSTVETQTCTCPPGTAPGDACPMHHAHEGKRECVLKNVSSPVDALLSLFASLGLVPPTQTLIASLISAEGVPPATFSAIAHPVRPEAPPPRA